MPIPVFQAPLQCIGSTPLTVRISSPHPHLRRHNSTASPKPENDSPDTFSSESRSRDSTSDVVSTTLDQSTLEAESTDTPKQSKSDNPWAFLYEDTTPKPNNRASDTTGFLKRSAVQPRTPNRLMKKTGDEARTITRREMDMFSKIFDTILAGKPANTPESRSEGGLGGLFGNSASGLSERKDVLSFGPGEGRSTDSQAVEQLNAYPPSLRAFAAKATGLPSWVGKEAKKTLTEAERQAEEARAAELDELRTQMRACTTNLELSEFIDTTIFGKLEAAESHERAALLSPNYPHLILEAIRLLRRQFGSYPLASATFDRVKRLGPESYVIGLTTKVYNAHLITRWLGWHDLHDIHELIREMRTNAVEPDTETADIVREIILSIEAGRRKKTVVLSEEDLYFITELDKSRFGMLKEIARRFEEAASAMNKAEGARVQTELVEMEEKYEAEAAALAAVNAEASSSKAIATETVYQAPAPEAERPQSTPADDLNFFKDLIREDTEQAFKAEESGRTPFSSSRLSEEASGAQR
ncbi:hypothetical protein YB2330_001847 [Saitoella coloradoensis]